MEAAEVCFLEQTNIQEQTKLIYVTFEQFKINFFWSEYGL